MYHIFYELCTKIIRLNCEKKVQWEFIYCKKMENFHSVEKKHGKMKSNQTIYQYANKNFQSRKNYK